MSRRIKLILAAIVLVIGGGLAWQFRHVGERTAGDGELTGPFATPSPLGPANPPLQSAQSPAPIVRTESPAPAADPVAAPRPAAPATAIGTAVVRPKPGVGDDGGVPELSNAYTGTAGRDIRSPTPIGGVGDGGPFDRNPRPEGLGDSGIGPTHKVADGDSLGQLAQRYLGSADRWREIYEYNRDVLTNPDLLPIGAELRIPVVPFRMAQQPAPPQTNPPSAAAAAFPPPTAQNVSQPVRGPTEQPKPSDENLVPVPATSAAGKPAVKLQRLPPVGSTAPVARALRVAPRTYIVQPGDTLNSIAEKLYGDGGRETILRAANQNLLPAAESIRPGMVLVVPSDSRQ